MAFMSLKQNKQANHESACGRTVKKKNGLSPGGAGNPWERRCKQKQHTKQNKSTGGEGGGPALSDGIGKKTKKKTVSKGWGGGGGRRP